MSIGGLIAYGNFRISNRMIANTLSCFGAMAIFIAALIISKNSIFPGWWALFPTIGAAGIILAGH
jgi:peptidoglycan/LPS O-acetylase OafA/YrhL